MSGHLSNSERWFSNEISMIIIEYLGDDWASLRNTALVCKDFAALSQALIFQTLQLGTKGRLQSPPAPKKFAALLHEPQTAFLGKFVRRLDLDPYDLGRTQFPTTEFIFRNLPSLTEVRIENGRVEHFQAIGMHLGAQLRRLQITTVLLRLTVQVRMFQKMLDSLSVLKTLILNFWSVEDFSDDTTPLVLPSSLNTAVIIAPMDEYSLRAISLGLQICYPPTLHTIFVDFRKDRRGQSVLWEAIRLDTMIILDLGVGSTGEADKENALIRRIITATQGLRATKLTLRCTWSTSLVTYLAYFIANLPYPVHDVCVDFSNELPRLDSFGDWIKLDCALMSRRDLGMLDRVYFGRSATHIQPLLPRSDGAGILAI
ncbi:hypothetical protein BDP27DRAFT_726533 [Rhodocollybia butyracea]|uniref:Uncharacterized protein n=1 Tax=Rhodocollybia butyracea TaxID=206335 RepID=A0A9P5PU69_9AGAR|nr:hypothetical protein BDP27DRAFT_726533 [Rhodocollybia butyracea]